MRRVYHETITFRSAVGKKTILRYFYSMRVLNLFGEHLTEEARKMLSDVGKVDSRVMTQTELQEAIEPYDILFMGLYPEISRAVLDKAKHLKVIVAVTTNISHIDASAEERGIKIISLKHETEFLNTITGTAELAVGLMIDLLRRTPWAFEDVKQYHWRRDRFRGHNLYGKTLGIFGFGRLGKWVARYGRAFNMKVLAYSPHIDEAACKALDCEAVDFKTLLSKSDIISINAHYTEETKHIFNKDVFKQMKKNAIIVNTASGGIVEENELVDALEEAVIAGYATDVLEDELHFDEDFSNNKLIEYAKTHENAIIVPHTGGMTHESREATDVFLAKKLIEYIKQ